MSKLCICIPSQTSTSPSTFTSPIWLIKIVTCDLLSIEFSFIQAPFPLRQLHKIFILLQVLPRAVELIQKSGKVEKQHFHLTKLLSHFKI